MDALTIHEAAETTGWSPRMLRYIERVGLVEPAALGRGLPPVRRRPSCSACAPCASCSTDFDIGLGDVGFAQRLRNDADLRARGRGAGSRPSRSVPKRPGRRLAALRAGEARAPSGRRRAADPPPSGDRMTATPTDRDDFKVADLSLAEFGRKEIRLAEHEMPGLMATARGVRATRSRSRARASPARCT